MANTVFKHHQEQQHQQQHHHQQYHQQHHNLHHHGHQHHYGGGSGTGNASLSGISAVGTNTGGAGNSINNSNTSSSTLSSSSSNHNHNNSNQNSIFVLNAETKISPNSCRKFYLDFNDNSVDSNLTQPASCNGATGIASASSGTSSVWSSASSTMCSPAAHAIQKLFNCSSGSSTKHQGNYNVGIDSKSAFKTSKSELLKKKTKFWQYLEGETTAYEGIDSQKGKSRKHKSKYWSKSNANDNQNTHNDLSELLEYSCSLCDNCRCMDCQIGYFDCDNSDDSNSEYSFHMNAYEEDDDIETGMELKTTITTSAAAAAGIAAATFCDGRTEEQVEEENQNSLHTLGGNKMDNKNTIQQLEYETSSSTYHTSSSTRRATGNPTEANNYKQQHNEMLECCHQCYGLEVEQHCLDFHGLYSGNDFSNRAGDHHHSRHH